MNTNWLLLALVCSSAVAHAGELYKWTDDNGVLHYSDAPPPRSVNPARVRVQRGVLNNDADAASHGPAATASTASTATGSNTAASNSNPAQSDRGKQCEQARSNLELLRSKYQVADASGKAIDESARQKMLVEAQQFVDDCRAH